MVDLLLNILMIVLIMIVTIDELVGQISDVLDDSG